MVKKVLYPHVPGKAPNLSKVVRLKSGLSPFEMRFRDNLAKMKIAINDDIAKGLIPATVESFSQMHDYVDANEYLEIPFPDFSVQDIDEANRYLDTLDAWIKQGRP